MGIFEKYKSIRVSEKAYRQLQEMAEREHVTLKEAVDVLLDLRGRIQQDVKELRRYLRALAYDLRENKYISQSLQEGPPHHLDGPTRVKVEDILRRLRD